MQPASRASGETNFLKGCLLVSSALPNGLRNLLINKTNNEKLLSSECIDSYDFHKLHYLLMHSVSILDKKVSQGITCLTAAQEEFFEHLSENSMTNTELESVKQHLMKGFVGLGLPLDDINDICKIVAFSEEEALTAYEHLSQEKRAFCYLGPRCYHTTIQRPKEVAMVLEQLQELSQQNPKGNCTVYVNGNRGCGKSELAKQVAKSLYRLPQYKADSFDPIAIMVLNAETEETLLFSYVRLAKEVLCNFTQVEMGITSMGLTLEERIRLLKNMIGIQLKKYSYWVVIVDNVNHFDALSNYWPTPGSEEWGRGHLIVTLSDIKANKLLDLDSSGHVTLSHGHVTLSHGMQPSEAIQLLSEVSNVRKKDFVLEVAEMLEFQPLALSCAAVFVRSLPSKKVESPWKTYLELYSKLCQDEVRQTVKENYLESSLIAIQMLLRQLLSQNQDISDITYLLSLFYPFSVKKETIGRCLEDITDTNIEQCLQDLSPFLAVEVSQIKAYHQLQDIYKSALGHERDGKQISILGFAIASLAHKLSKLENHSSLINSANHCLSRDSSILASELGKLSDSRRKEIVNFLNECTTTNDDAVDIFLRIAEQCHLIQKPENAVALLEIAKAVLEDERNDFARTARYALVLHRLGNVCRDMGHDEAKSYLEKVLQLYCKEKEVPHESVADVLEGLGDVSIATEDISDAKMFYTKALETRSASTHPNVFLSWYKLGNILALEGSFQQAKEHYEKALKLLDNVKSNAAVNHNLVKILTCVGAMSVCVGDYELARKYLERAMRIEERRFSKFHPCRLSSIKNTANTCTALGDNDNAENLLRESLEISQNVIGRLDPEVAQVYSQLGSLRAAQEDWKSAIEYYNNALEIRENTILCQFDPVLADSYCDLGHAYASSGELENAKSFHERALGIRGLVFKGNHPDIGTSYFRLGKVYNKLGDSQTAMSLLERAVEIREKVCGAQHPETLASIYHLGHSFARLGQLSNAKDLYQTVADGQEKLPGSKLDLAKTSSSLAEVNLGLGEVDVAKEQFKRAIELQEGETGPDHPEVARPLVKLALVHEHCNEMREAKTLLEMALAIYKKSVCRIGQSQLLVTEAHLKRVLSKLPQNRCLVM